MTKTVLIGLAKNQAPYVMEWVAHHLAVGFDDFVFCVYGSSDGTAKVTRRLSAMGYGHHIKIEPNGKDPGPLALEQINQTDLVSDADWIGMLDLSEFLNVRQGHGSVDELTSDQSGDSSAIVLPTYTFGLGPKADADAPPVEICNRRGTSPQIDSLRPTLARSLDALTKKSTAAMSETGLAQVNRYACRSLDHLYQLLALCSSTAEAQDVLADWKLNNQTKVEDKSAARYLPLSTKYLTMLKSDQRLQKVYRLGHEKHKQRAETAKGDPELAALLSDIAVQSS